MMKKILCLFIICSLTPIFSGCWSYRGLDELFIVAGVAIDKAENGEGYLLTFEAIDLSGSIKNEGPKPNIVESEGNTIFDAIRNAKKSTDNKLYFSDALIVVISNEVAKTVGVSFCIDFFVRNTEPRETLSVVIAKDTTAKTILINKPVNNKIVSFELKGILEDDNKVTSATHNMNLYKIFNTLNSPGVSLTLPAFNTVMNDDKPTNSLDGIAAFKDELMVGYLTPEETKYYLFIIDKIKGGILTIGSSDEMKDNISLEFFESKTKKSYTYADNVMKVVIEPTTKVYISEMQGQLPKLDETEIQKYEYLAQAKLSAEIENVIKKAQNELHSDIFGFGNMVYRKDPKLWGQISGDWDNLFQTMQFEIKPKIKIINTVSIKK